MSRDTTPDTHLFPTRPYDLVKEFVIAMVVVGLLTVLLAAVFSSPDRKAITLANWASAAPEDVVATATAELAGTSTSASYGAPYNRAADGQKLGPLPVQRWGSVRIPIDSANDLVITPLSTVTGNPDLTANLQAWRAATPDQQTTWAVAYSDALAAAPDGDPTKVASGDYGPVPVIATGFLAADGAYLEDQARADHLGGDQWGMMNETANYPGQPWMWLYTFWYQVKPFSTSDNADALVWALMAVLTLGLILVPFIPGLRSLPRHLGVHRLIWRNQP